MKTLPWLIVIILLGIVAYLLMRDPGPSEIMQQREEDYKTEIAILKTDIASIQAQGDTIIKESMERTRKDSMAIIARNKEIQRWKKIAAERESRIPDVARETYPIIDSVIAAKDSVIHHIVVKADSLQAQVYSITNDLRALSKLHISEREIAERMFKECEKRKEDQAAEYEQMLKNERKKKPVIGLVSGGIGVLVGLLLAL